MTDHATNKSRLKKWRGRRRPNSVSCVHVLILVLVKVVVEIECVLALVPMQVNGVGLRDFSGFK